MKIEYLCSLFFLVSYILICLLGILYFFVGTISYYRFLVLFFLFYPIELSVE